MLWKGINTTFSECVFVALFIQYTKRARHILLSFMACPAYQIYPHYPINGTIFGKVLWNIKCLV